MDIISYSQGKKAKKQVAELNQRLGYTDKYKHGDKDIKDKYDSVDKRITKMEQTAAPGILNKKISDLSANTMVNLNKHNLKVKGLLNATHYNHKDMIFENFNDETGIDTTKSSYYILDNGAIKQQNSNKQATIVTKNVKCSVQPENITVAISYNEDFIETVNVPLSDGMYDKTLINQNALSLTLNGTEYNKAGIFESDIIDLGDNFLSLNQVKFSKTLPSNSEILIEIAHSDDGIIFSSYLSILPNGQIPFDGKRYIKIRVTLKSGTSIEPKVKYDFDEKDKDYFTFGENIIFDNALKLKMKYSGIALKDSNIFVDSGCILKYTIERNKYQSIRKVEVL